MIIRQRNRYNFENIAWDEDASSYALDPVFLLAFEAVPTQLDGVLFGHDCSCVARCISAVQEYGKDNSYARCNHNYYSALARDPQCRVLEVSLTFDKDPRAYTIGVPLAFLPSPEKEHSFAVLFDGVHFQLLCDGLVVDREAPMGLPCHCYPCAAKDRFPFTILSSAIRNFRFTNDLEGFSTTVETWEDYSPIQFYTPEGYNVWAGDVTLAYFKGRLHLFFLYDRRHHGCRKFRGAHEFHHLSSADLANWEEHGPVVAIHSDWESVGTGNAFVWNDKLYLAYGLHTERTRDYQDTANHLFYEHLALYGNTGSYKFSELGRLTPGGASYYVSEDGFHFKASKRLIHYLENPTIKVQPDNTLTITQDGIWKSDHLGDWVIAEHGFPTHNEKSFAKNILDCPAYFDLDGWEYLVIGFTGYWARSAKTSPWIDFAEKGWDTYDGTNVPMYATMPDGRVIECGWAYGLEDGWGGALLFREMVPLGNGRIGKRFVQETLPGFKHEVSCKGNIVLSGQEGDTMIESSFDTSCGHGTVSILLEAVDGKCAEFVIDIANARAQAIIHANGYAAGVKMPTYAECAAANPQAVSYAELGDQPHLARNYAMANLIGLRDVALRVRLLIHANGKNQGMLADCEIAGHHTLCLRADYFFPSKVTLSSSTEDIVLTACTVKS